MTEQETFDIIFLRHGESVGNAESRWQIDVVNDRAHWNGKNSD